MCIASETSQSILPIYYSIGINAFLQGLIAWRAYIDQTPAQNSNKTFVQKID